MNAKSPTPVIEKARIRFQEIAGNNHLLDANVSVLAKPLTPEEAIGQPGRRDFPIVLGKERVVESVVQGFRGHAFTDSAGEFLGTIQQVLSLDLENSKNRAIFLATLNAVLSRLGMAKATVHCRDEEPEQCAREIAERLSSHYGNVKLGLIGLNPALAEALAGAFGPDRFRMTDLNADNIGERRFGVEVWDGRTRTRELIDWADRVLLTGTTLTNGTFDSIWDSIQQAGKKGLVYGVTAAGISRLFGVERICPFGRDR